MICQPMADVSISYNLFGISRRAGLRYKRKTNNPSFPQALKRAVQGFPQAFCFI
jgi:hypothetical protein